MRVGIDTLFASPDRPGSIIDYLVNLIKTLDQIDSDTEYVVFVSPRNRSLFEPTTGPKLAFVNCHFSNEKPFLRILAQQALIPYHIRQLGIEVLCSLADVAPLFAPCPVVLKVNTLHHYHTPRALGWARTWYRRMMIAASARRAKCIIANSEHTKADICQYLRGSAEKVWVIYEAVDEIFAPIKDGARLRKYLIRRYGLERDYILFASTLYPYKNLETLLRAFALLSATPHWSSDLVVAGPDFEGQLDKMQTLTNELGLSQHVRFLGFVPNQQMRELYCGAQVFVYPSLSETFGKPLVEAMRCGIPVVASCTGAIPEILEDAGLLVDPHDAKEIAEAIAQVAANESLRATLIRKGLERAQDFSWPQAARAILAICRQAVDEKESD